MTRDNLQEPQLLEEKDIEEVLKLAVAKENHAVMSHMASGRWHMTDVVFVSLSDTALHISLTQPDKPRPLNIEINQPVGISFQYEFNKYIFETAVAGFESSVKDTSSGRIVLEKPDRVERMQRRAYVRVAVPSTLSVKVLFWHRGYTDNSMEVPLENYWQGKLVDLSAGGAQIAVDNEQGPNFRAGQLVGMKFTPMSYQRPFLLEAHVRHLAQNANQECLYIGLEFLGLEASDHGREILRRLINVVQEYQKQNPEKPDEAHPPKIDA